jgi:hypothetical protein
MKLKCINADCNLTNGKIYKAEISNVWDNHYQVINDNGCKRSYSAIRFEVIEETLEDQLEEAKQKVKDLEEQIEANKIKVGQKYKSNSGDTIWMIASFNGKYAFVCIEGSYDVGLSYSGKLHDKIEDVFDGHLKYFTLIK